MASPHVCAPCARRTAAAAGAFRDAGIEVHEARGHDDQTDSTSWGAAFYPHLVSAERERLCEKDVLT